MYFVYQPEGSGEPRRFPYDPNKMMSPEMELIEKLTGLPYGEFGEQVMTSARCRRVLLFVLLRREHPTIKFDDINFAWDETDIKYSRDELRSMLDEVRAADDESPERNRAIRLLESELASAPDEDEGKAHSNSEGSNT